VSEFIEVFLSIVSAREKLFEAHFGVSFAPEKLTENCQELINALIKAKPATAKGTYLKSIFMATTMSPSISIDTKSMMH
jgi:ribosomal protein L1